MPLTYELVYNKLTHAPLTKIMCFWTTQYTSFIQHNAYCCFSIQFKIIWKFKTTIRNSSEFNGERNWLILYAFRSKSHFKTHYSILTLSYGLTLSLMLRAASRNVLWVEMSLVLNGHHISKLCWNLDRNSNCARSGMCFILSLRGCEAFCFPKRGRPVLRNIFYRSAQLIVVYLPRKIGTYRKCVITW